MELKVEVVSKETIKPHSPTPKSLRHYQLSFLDQISPPVYNPLVIFYNNESVTENAQKSNKLKNSISKALSCFNSLAGNKENGVETAQKSDRLKKSLSKVLCSFYPLAGRLHGDLIECNDEGIPYVEAHVKCHLGDVLQNPIPSELSKLIPFKLEDVNELVLGVQFNIFDCGGIAIGICISHKIADALSFFNFIKAWSACAREDSDQQDIISPQFESSKLFPPIELSGFSTSIGITKENVVAKRFLFHVPAIEALKAIYAKDLGLKNQRPPTRVEALSAFIWSRFMHATQVEPDNNKKLYTIVHAVNLRTRIDPPLPETSFGNLFRMAFTIPSMSSAENGHNNIVSQMREEISRIDKDYVKMLQDGSKYMDILKQGAEAYMKGEMVSFNITSLCRFPLYEADFGWAKPAWVGSPALTYENLVVFVDAKTGGGIEAYVHLSVENMAKLEGDNEFLTYATIIGR